MNVLERPAQNAYLGLNRARRSLYRSGLLPRQTLPRPVVSIGNLAAGGTGKTPLTIAVAEALRARGLRIAILTRGYGRRSRGYAGVVESQDPALFGDEPVLMARRLPGVDVVVGENRHDAGMRFLHHRNCDLFMLDDGFQHLQLHRDLDIVIVDSRPGWYREDPSALRDADIVVERIDTAGTPVAKGRFPALLVASSILIGADQRPASTLEGKSVVAFSGLAVNDRFFETLHGLGAQLAECVRYPDHHAYTSADLESLRSTLATRGADMLVTTEKDAVKIDASDIARLEVSMQLPEEFYGALFARLDIR